MQRQAPRATSKDEPEPERADGRRLTISGRASRDQVLMQFRQARRRLGAAARH